MKFFSLDVHIAVINDVKHILKNIYGDKIEFTDWTMSYEWYLFYTSKPKVKHITSENWRFLNSTMIEEFLKEYGNYLSTFDGFIVSHNPSFVLLYESFNKPIIVVNTCRYEQPFSFAENNDLNGWKMLNEKLAFLHKTGRIIVVSNNRADQDYLEMGTGIKSTYIPSLCEYTKATYNPVWDVFVYSHHPKLHHHKLIDIHQFAKKPYTWERLYSCKGIVHFPYEISTMSIFEQYAANVPLFFPSKKLLKEMLKTKKCGMQCRYIDVEKHKHPHRVYVEEVSAAYDDDKWIDWWIERADYYNTSKDTDLKYITYFDSIDELCVLIEQIDTKKISEQMKQHNKYRKQKIHDEWKKIMDVIML